LADFGDCCPKPQSLRFSVLMEVDVTTEIAIARPRSVVASFAADPNNVPSWYAKIHVVRWRSAPELRVGAQVDFEAKFLGKTLAYTYEIREYVADQVLVMATTQGPFPMETTYRWSSTDSNHTIMTLRNRGVPHGFSKWMAPFMSFAMRRASQKDLSRLKAVLEAKTAA
jgi:hypothetical protein